MSPPSSRKVVTGGTHRVRAPEETWDLVAPRRGEFGVSRISDVTGLDTLGIPVAMAVRPLSWTLSVSQGKGQTLLLAKVSALMESVELWHAERAVPPASRTATPARELDLPYTPTDLAVEHGPFLSDATPLDWIGAVGLLTGRSVLVPREAVAFPDPSRQRWTPASLRCNSNGLASGNSRDEAAVHALYELVERDVLSRPPLEEIAAATSLDPLSLPDETCLAMVRAVQRAGGRVSVQHLPNDFGVPTFRALVWSWEFPLPCVGYGSHCDPVTAVSRAVTEAAQGRLAAIAGSRDDLEHFYDVLDRPRRRAEYLAPFAPPTATFDEAVTAPAVHDDVSEELAWLTRVVHEVVGREPLLTDLSTDPDFAVVKVILPGGTFAGDRVHARHERAS